ncbi:MAG: Unknown protein [uncultured Sulfurovum sp.]|uniref:Uncharacterized protein n=1 Tax=uncultured Sulfurovum sp. TaxID=269237 RepID=A0A6S6SU43_9BACT|nr:MAG: Unknown protein [uncultured Sulfurovum sp.]
MSIIVVLNLYKEREKYVDKQNYDNCCCVDSL